MLLPETSRLARVNAVLNCAAYIVYIVGFATQYWLDKEFIFPLNVAGITGLKVHANVGLVTACKIETYANGKSSTNCSAEGAATWQVLAAVLAIGGLVVGVLGVLIAVLSVVSKRLAGKPMIRAVVVLCNMANCCCFVGPLIMFAMNKKIQVKPEVSTFQVDFDLGFSYKVATASVWIYAFLTLLNILEIIWSDGKNKQHTKEDQFTLTKHKGIS